MVAQWNYTNTKGEPVLRIIEAEDDDEEGSALTDRAAYESFDGTLRGFASKYHELVELLDAIRAKGHAIPLHGGLEKL